MTCHKILKLEDMQNMTIDQIVNLYRQDYNLEDSSIKSVQQTSNTDIKSVQQTSNTDIKSVQQTSNTDIKSVQQTSNTDIKSVQQTSNVSIKSMQQTSNTDIITILFLGFVSSFAASYIFYNYYRKKQKFNQ